MKKDKRPELSFILSQMDRLVESEEDPYKGLNACLRSMVSGLGAERGFVLVFNGDGTELYALLGYGVDPDSLFVSEDISQTIIFTAVEEDRPILSMNAMEDPRFATNISVQLSGIRSVLCVPLHSGTVVLGLLYLDNRSRKGCFDVSDRDYLVACAKKFSELLVLHRSDF